MSDKTSRDLLPCPFCGSPAKQDYGATDFYHYITCGADCAVGPSVSDKEEERCIKAWNTRAALAAPEHAAPSQCRIRCYSVPLLERCADCPSRLSQASVSPQATTGKRGDYSPANAYLRPGICPDDCFPNCVKRECPYEH